MKFLEVHWKITVMTKWGEICKGENKTFKSLKMVHKAGFKYLAHNFRCKINNITFHERACSLKQMFRSFCIDKFYS